MKIKIYDREKEPNKEGMPLILVSVIPLLGIIIYGLIRMVSP